MAEAESHPQRQNLGTTRSPISSGPTGSNRVIWSQRRLNLGGKAGGKIFIHSVEKEKIKLHQTKKWPGGNTGVGKGM